MVHSSIQSCPKTIALPLIFVPGIMGSRLRISGTTDIVWEPQDSIVNALGIAHRDAAGKRDRMIGSNGAAYSPGYLEVDPGQVGDFLTRERIERGWGGLMQGSYAGFMGWLENIAGTSAAGQLPGGGAELNYEVWAHPYNWTDDNLNSGKALGETVAKAVAETSRKYSDTDIRVLKPVIVTHSMGGLVARAYTQIHGGASDVHGVIHGALPCDGSPAAYKRIVAGFDGGGIKGTIERHVLGANQQEATATAANMPGVLELLPNQTHKSIDGDTKWLFAKGHDDSRLWAKPLSNPYGEIYLNQKDWWRLIVREYLNPGGKAEEAFFDFRHQLRKAIAFHAQLGPSAFHPNTRMFFANDAGHPSFDHVEWKQTAQEDDIPLDAEQRNDGRGTHEWGQWYLFPTNYGVQNAFQAKTRYEIQPPDAPGDGTVHAGSGKYVSGPMSEPLTNGFEHQAAFDSTEARRLTARWLFDMVEEQL
jgi:pimeloyl-ACP methyl ester carboxylesterase